MDNAMVIGGLGVVGQATRKLLGIKDYYDTRGSTLNLKQAAKKKYIFITLPTEPDIDGYNTDDIFNLIQQIEQYPYSEKMYILRSTVIPGTSDALMTRLNIENIVYVPEFLTMSSIDEDTWYPDILVIGAKRDHWAKEVMNIFLDKVKSRPKIFLGSNAEAEMIKLAVNLFYVNKVVWANQIYDICNKVNINYDRIKPVFELRKYMSKNHFNIWKDGYRGAGGKCLRKDLIATNRAFNMPLFVRLEQINETLLGQKKNAEK